MLWEECAAVGMPRAVVVTHLDQPRGRLRRRRWRSASGSFGEGVQPLYLPLLGDDELPAGLVGLLSQNVIDYSDPGRGTSRPADAEQRAAIVEEPRRP